MKNLYLSNDAQRLQALRRWQPPDTAPEAAFDDLAQLAATICQTPAALISFVDADRVWVKSRIGLEIRELPHDLTLYAQGMREPEEIFEVEDVTTDPRFTGSELVKARPQLQYYAGAALVAQDGQVLGTLCVMDVRPRKMSPAQLESLRALARQVVAQVELRCMVQNQALPSDQSTDEISRLREQCQQLQESESRFRELAENIQEVFWISDPVKNEMIYVSPAFEAIWGRPCIELHASQSAWLDALHPEDRPRVEEALAKRQLDGSYDEEYRIIRPDGSIRWIRDRAFPVRDSSGEIYHVTGIAQDITPGKHTEEHLREQASLLDKAQDAIVVRNLEHRITYWNKSAERLYGWTSEEVMGRSVKEVLYNDLSTFREASQQVLQEGEWQGELDQVRKDGQALVVEGRWTLLRDAEGQPKGILAINTDITRQKQMEHQFRRAQRMESIGALAGGIAHDLNNVLTPITMAIDFLRLKIADPKVQDVLETIASSAKRGAEVVGQVLSFARGVEGRRTEVQPRHLVSDIERICRETFPKDIQISTFTERGLWTIQGDSTQLHQMLLNLCVNARDAMLRGGNLTVRARNVTLDTEFAAMNIEASAGPHVVFEVEDTGTGMPKEVIERIFDPFFTTKQLGQGTGLGLSTTLSIIKSHGGFVQVDSEPGRGTHFSVHLPARPISLPEAEQEGAHELPRGRGETVLVVDDEAFVRQITRQTLEAFGYKVMLANEGAEAVTIYAQHKGEISVVLTDMMMPVMDGASTIMVLKRMNPEVRVIASSGITTERNALKAQQAGVKHFIPKPYTADTLLTLLKKVVDDRS